jgi:hypothetical protein
MRHAIDRNVGDAVPVGWAGNVEREPWTLLEHTDEPIHHPATSLGYGLASCPVA